MQSACARTAPAKSPNRALAKASSTATAAAVRIQGRPRSKPRRRQCNGLLPGGSGPSPQLQEQMQEHALKFSACMRSHGEPSFPDPSGGGSGHMRIGGPGSGIAPSSPLVQGGLEGVPAVLRAGGLRGLTMSVRARKPAVLAAGLAGVALALAGCGGSSSPGVAHLSSGKGTSLAGSESNGFPPESTASPEQAGVAFSKCMRASGVPNFPDPTAGGGLSLPAGMNPSSPAFKAAQAKCRKLLPGGGPPGPGSSTNPSPRTLARFLRIAQCMREHGVYDFPDPQTSVPSNPFGSGRAGVISDIEGVILIFPGTIDQQSPMFTRASAACAFPLHNQ